MEWRLRQNNRHYRKSFELKNDVSLICENEWYKKGSICWP